MQNRYRIVRDMIGGYQVQIKYWYFPFIWFECNGNFEGNTFISLATAEKFAVKHATNGSVVKNLGKLP